MASASKHELCSCFQEKQLQTCDAKRNNAKFTHYYSVKNDTILYSKNIDFLKVHWLPFIIAFPSLKKYEIEF